MAFETFTDFLSELDAQGELHRIRGSVSSRFEIAAITRLITSRTDRAPALLFEQVDGQSVPVVTNLLGSESRMLAALRVEKFSDLADRMLALIAPEIPQGWQNALQLVPRVMQLMKLPPVEIQTGRSQQVVRVGKDVNLSTLPIPYSWSGESGPVLTAGIVHAVDPLSGARILRQTMLELKSADSVAVHIHPAHELHAAAHEFRRRGEQMPVAVSLGVDPALWFTSQLPLPRGTDPAVFAGFLRNKPLELVKARSQPVLVPAQAELVLEGYFDANEPWVKAGPIASPTGHYGPEETAPILHLTTVTHTTNPVLHASIVGPPPNEEHWIGRAREQLFLPLIRLFVRDVINVHAPRSGLFRNMLFVSIRKTHPQHARQAMQALWGLHGLAHSKMLVVVDEDIDVTDEELVWYTVGTNVHPGSDVVLAEGPLDAYDHSSPLRYAGQKMGLDATRKLVEEGHTRGWPDRVEIPAETRRRIIERWNELGLPGEPPVGAEL